MLRIWEHEEHLGPILAGAQSAIQARATAHRAEVLAHREAHEQGAWCTMCETWPHSFGSTGADGSCDRCEMPPSDHEWFPEDWRFFGPPPTV